MKTKFKLDLQLFAKGVAVAQTQLDLQLCATQTTLLNGSGNDLSPEMKTFYDKTLITLAEPALVHDQFGQKRPIPKNGGKTIEFRKFSALPKALTPITEGVTPAGNKLNVSAMTATVSQYGDYIEQSDILQLTAIDNTVVEATKKLAAQAGATMDTVVRNELCGGTNVMYAPKGDGTPVTTRATLDATCKVTVDLIFRAAALLKSMNAQKIDGSYVAIVHPFVAYDIMMGAGEAWVDINKYSNADKIFNGEIGKLGGVRFVETTEAKIWTGDGCPSGLAVFATLVLGADAYGVTEIEGGGLQHIVKQLGYGADPLNQRSSVGWKGIKTAKRLVEEYMVRIESCSSYSKEAEAN